MSVDFLEPVSSRSTVQDGIYRQLRNALMSGHFDPGQTLTIAMLADSFRTSHMPVRLAYFSHQLDWTSDPYPNSAMVPADALNRLQGALHE